MYLGIIGGTYYMVATSSFKYIPGYYISELHRSISMLAVGVGVLLFLLTSFSDPGTVTAENVSQYLSAYPYDNVIYVEKECPTCKIPKPDRSKHCGICDRCVARFDHHCGWMNNCIGEKNTWYFMAFLIWHFLLCLYGATFLGLILADQLKESKIIFILTESFSSLFPHIVQWLLSSYNTQILITVFLAVVSMLLAGFFGYHAHLCFTNTITNETFKWQEYIGWKTKLNEAKVSAAALKASIHGMSGDVKALESRWRSRWWSRITFMTEESSVMFLKSCFLYQRDHHFVARKHCSILASASSVSARTLAANCKLILFVLKAVSCLLCRIFKK